MPGFLRNQEKQATKNSAIIGCHYEPSTSTVCACGMEEKKNRAKIVFLGIVPYKWSIRQRLKENGPFMAAANIEHWQRKETKSREELALLP